MSILLPPEILGKSAGAAFIAGSALWWQIFFIVFLGPVFETLNTQSFLLELLRLLQCRTVLATVICSFFFGLGHYLNGGLGHGITAALAGTVFAYAYLSRRRLGMATAFCTTAVAHMINNALAFTLIAIGAA